MNFVMPFYSVCVPQYFKDMTIHAVDTRSAQFWKQPQFIQQEVVPRKWYYEIK